MIRGIKIKQLRAEIMVRHFTRYLCRIPHSRVKSQDELVSQQDELTHICRIQCQIKTLIFWLGVNCNNIRCGNRVLPT